MARSDELRAIAFMPPVTAASERRTTMERDDIPLELGTASAQTKGPIFGATDLMIGSPEPSLGDD